MASSVIRKSLSVHFAKLVRDVFEEASIYRIRSGTLHRLVLLLDAATVQILSDRLVDKIPDSRETEFLVA
jgi:hypothetical protein